MIQRLELVDRLFPPLFTGEKTSTLRWREGDVSEGFLVYYATKNPRWQVLVWVTKVKSAPLSSFASHYGMSAGELLESMRVHYPKIEIETQVLFIEHLSPQETLRLHGMPDELKGKVQTSIEELAA